MAENKSAFEAAGDEAPISLGAEFVLFLKENKKWWLLPIVVVLSLVAILAALGASGAAPFIYVLF